MPNDPSITFSDVGLGLEAVTLKRNAAEQLISPEDNDEGLTVFREAWGGFSITDTNSGTCVQIDDPELVRRVALALLREAA